jgi:hypothetical protein
MMNTRTQFDSWSSLFNAGPAIVRAYSPEKASFIVTTDQSISILSCSIPSADSTPTKDLFDRLKDLKTKYSSVWLPGSLIPNESAFEDARNFVRTLPLMQILNPSIHVAADGEVTFEWKQDNFHIDLGFYGDNTFSYYATKTGQQPLFGDDIPVERGIPKELVDVASVI